MKKNVLTAIVCFIAYHLSAQMAVQYVYGDALSEYGYALDRVGSGWAIAGITSSFSSEASGIFLARTDNQGNPSFLKMYEGGTSTFGLTWGTVVKKMSENSLIVGGYTDDFGAQNNKDMLVMKTDTSGSLLWSFRFGDAGHDRLNDVYITANKEMILTGQETKSGNAGDNKLIVLQTDSTGALQWKTFVGGNNLEFGYSVTQDFDGNIYALGFSNSFGSGDYDVYLVKLDSTGTLLWSKTYGGSGDEKGYVIRRLTVNSLLVAGITSTYGSGGTDAFLMEIDTAGDVQWFKTYGGSGTDNIRDMVVMPNYKVAMCGWTDYTSPMALGIFTTLNGNLLSSKVYGGSGIDKFYAVSASSTAIGFTGAASSTEIALSVNSGLYNDMYLVQTDIYGNMGCYDSTISLSVTDTMPAVNMVSSQVSNMGALIAHTPVVSAPALQSNLICSNDYTSAPGGDVMVNTLNIYPNPAHHSISISIPNPNNITCTELYDLLGTPVRQWKITQSQQQLGLDGISPGIYYLIGKGKGDTAVARLVIF